MPRKGFSNFDDYDDGFDDDDAYDYDYGDDDEDEHEADEPKEVEIEQQGIWRCAICTYDNDERMLVCEICGVIRHPVAGGGNQTVNNITASMKQKEKQVSSEQNHLKKGGHRSETSSQGRHANLGGIKSGRSLPKAKADTSNETNSSSKNMEASESLTGTMNKMSLSGETEVSGNVKIRSARAKSNHKPDEWMLLDKESDTLSQLNLAIVGHVDSGKSTLSGRLLHLLGRISQKQMHKFEKEAKLQGKGSFAYAWALDESAEERERGITMTVAVAYFNTKRHHVVLLDSPGHKDFVPNMIAGATQADAAILVIDASIGAFEAGFDNLKGQTREHARVLRGFGVEQVIVAVNKMDIVGYSRERFGLIKQHVGSFLQSCRFKESSLTWIPLSAIENQNLVSATSESRLSSWYQGPCLLDAIDSVNSPDRDVSKPLLMPICDVVRSTSQGQVSACGKLEAGAVRSGSKIMVMPSGDQGTVRSLERDSQTCTIARAGDNVALTLQGIDANQVTAGGVLCHPDYPVSVATHLELMVLVLEGATPILLGSQLEFHVHHAKEAATVVKLVAMLDPKTGEPTKKSPRCLTAKQSAMIEVSLQYPVCVETFSESRALGRVFLRSSGRTVAMGKVTRIIQDS
ncbi:hypothetical protein Bca52824_006268 [Brassica carinata]|uniref:Uncharacterized protein n=1 Tax=Brassica carinata TaxID=52824 RepID=A0A8X7WQB3_BRACI|nr:hypothetical protein Bca52824_006268 [Brassica carinata]